MYFLNVSFIFYSPFKAELLGYMNRKRVVETFIKDHESSAYLS